jgi:hypothetical protein
MAKAKQLDAAAGTTWFQKVGAKSKNKGGFLDVSIDIPKEVFQMLENLEHKTQKKVTKKAVREGAKIIAKAMRKEVPDSVKTGTRKGWSETTEKARARTPQLKKAIIFVTRNKRKSALGIIGPKWPAGQHAYPMTKGHRKVLWGRQAGGTVRGNDRWIKKVFDETKSAVQAKMLEVTKSEVANLRNG